MTEPHFGTGKNTTKIFGKLIDRINVVGPLLTNMHRETKSALDKVLVVTAGCFCSEYETVKVTTEVPMLGLVSQE